MKRQMLNVLKEAMNVHKKAKKGNKYNAMLYAKICPQIVSDYDQNCTTTELQLEIAFLLKNCFKSFKNN